MISKLTWFYLVFSTNALFFMGGSPFYFSSWDYKNSIKKLRVSIISRNNSRKRVFFTVVSFLVNIAYVLFILYRLLHHYYSYQDSGAKMFNFVMQMIYFFVSYLIPVVLQTQTFLKAEYIPQFIIAYLRFFSYYQYTHRQNLQEKFAKLSKFMTVVVIIGFLVNLENFMLLMKKPEKPQFLTSILVDPVNVHFVYRLPLMALQCWVWLNTWTNTYFYVFHMKIYVTCGLSMLKEIQ